MKESFWGIFVIGVGVAALLLIVLFQNITNTDQHNTMLLQEVTEAAMWDAVDYAECRATGALKINREKFVENFTRRYAESASRSRNYKLVFYSINETPPMVSVGVKSDADNGSEYSFSLSNKVDAILESPIK